ncbi:MAG: hypothetical protein FWD45_00360 [Coriobacteriia bacterium]|nr:hypothetical protein [Coriobacteriia bacterium]
MKKRAARAVPLLLALSLCAQSACSNGSAANDPDAEPVVYEYSVSTTPFYFGDEERFNLSEASLGYGHLLIGYNFMYGVRDSHGDPDCIVVLDTDFGVVREVPFELFVWELSDMFGETSRIYSIKVTPGGGFWACRSINQGEILLYDESGEQQLVLSFANLVATWSLRPDIEFIQMLAVDAGGRLYLSLGVEDGHYCVILIDQTGALVDSWEFEPVNGLYMAILDDGTPVIAMDIGKLFETVRELHSLHPGGEITLICELDSLEGCTYSRWFIYSGIGREIFFESSEACQLVRFDLDLLTFEVVADWSDQPGVEVKYAGVSTSVNHYLEDLYVVSDEQIIGVLVFGGKASWIRFTK